MHATLATAAAGNGFGRAKAAGFELEELFDGVDDLIRRVADTENPEIRKLRARVHFAMVAAKSACDDGASQVRGPGTQAAEAPLVDGTHRPVHSRPEPVHSRPVAHGRPEPAHRHPEPVHGHPEAVHGHPEAAHDHPRPALGVALLVGLGLGLIVSLRL